MEALVQRLVQNPHDQEAITYAHHAGQSDPRSYAMLLEKVGTGTQDPTFACHWLTEAAQVWSETLGDAHRAARALMIAIDRDPTQPAPADRLASLYRDKGDTKALVALLERRAKALAPFAAQDPEMRAHVAGIHEELGRLWADPPLSQTKKAIENYRRAIEYDQQSQYAIYSLRELLKGSQMWADAIPYFSMEIALSDDPERQIALYRDESEVRRLAGDLGGASDALRHAQRIDQGRDAALKQQLAALILERKQAGETLHESEVREAAQLFVDLAEEFPGDHAFSYSTCALDLDSGNDRAVQLAMYYAAQAGRESEVAPRAARYLKANPHGPLVAEARQLVSRVMASGEGTDESMIEALAPAADAPSPERVRGLLDVADALARKGKKNDAAAKYHEVLELDPANPDALAFLEGHLRQTRKYADLRDMLLNASKTPGVDNESRRGWLREIAGLCETQLRDLDTAISALKQLVALDKGDEGPKAQLKRLLERTGRWDDVATLLEQEAEQTGDIETRISMEKSLAKLHEQKRKDPVAAGEAWSRIAGLAPDDESAINTAVKLFERGERADLAAQTIADNVAQVGEPSARAPLFKKLGELREATGDALGAGDAYAESAAAGSDSAMWEAAERCFAQASSWEQAANAVDQRAQLTAKPKEQAGLFARSAEYLGQAGEDASAVLRLEQATDLDPMDDGLAMLLEQRYRATDRFPELAAFLLRRAEKVTEAALRVSLRKRAALLQRETLADTDAARASLVLLLTDSDDPEALSLLADDAEERGEPAEAVDYLHRLAKTMSDRAQKASVMLREARLVANGLDDADGAIARYESVLKELDPHNIEALSAVADLCEKLEDPKGTAHALERLLEATEAPEERLGIAQRLAALYEGPLDDPGSAVRVLDIVRGLDPEDYDAVQRLSDLCERLEDWPRVPELMRLLIEVEGDEEEVSAMTRRLAEILTEKLGKGDEALAALMEIADQGDAPCREAYEKLGDELGWKGIVATKLVEWFAEAPVGPDRHRALRGAFDRFLEVGREAEAAQVGQELIRTRGADPELAQHLEEIAVTLKHLEALGAAHDLLVQDLSGQSRAEEMVRQAEILVAAGVAPEEAIQHGEQALSSVAPAEVEPLLERLSKLAVAPGHVIDLYERQIVRCKAPPDRLAALARAAEVAADNDALDRARGFFDLALGAGVQEETLKTLEEVARAADQRRGDTRLTGILADALAAGGQGSRDGGRTRSALLRRAATIANLDLTDVDKAFKWLGDAIVTHVDDAGLDDLEALAGEVGDMRRSETVLSRALEEVFDGPLVRKLLARRAELRKTRLEDHTGAATDLKRLHDLSPSDTAVTDQLLALYTELTDYKGMVQLYEDMILRGKDPASRAELARKVARLWEEKLDDYREAADAWRRVLRMKSGDPEATEGLERAKAAMINKPSKAPPAAKSPEPPPPEAMSSPEVDELLADEPLAEQAEPEDEDEDGPTIPPTAPEDSSAFTQAENDLAALRPERPDLSFPSGDEVTMSQSLSGIVEVEDTDKTEVPSEAELAAAPPPSPSAPPPPSPSAPPPPSPSAPPIPVEDVDEDELIVDDDELFDDG
jgi:tetratricopeptide (TPR) repeat protein